MAFQKDIQVCYDHELHSLSHSTEHYVLAYQYHVHAIHCTCGTGMCHVPQRDSSDLLVTVLTFDGQHSKFDGQNAAQTVASMHCMRHAYIDASHACITGMGPTVHVRRTAHAHVYFEYVTGHRHSSICYAT